MKFQIWCTVHDGPVIAADSDANMVLKVPSTLDGPSEFEIDESNLYCRDMHAKDGTEHEFIYTFQSQPE